MLPIIKPSLQMSCFLKAVNDENVVQYDILLHVFTLNKSLSIIQSFNEHFR